MKEKDPLWQFVPQELLESRFNCIKCGKSSKIDWLRKRVDTIGAIESNDKSTYLVRLTAFEECEHCNSSNEIMVPNSIQKDKFYLFGDEAFRDIGDSIFYTYSLIGTSSSFIDEIEKELFEMKKIVDPNSNPADWKIHFKEIWSGQKRNNHPIFNNWTLKNTNNLLEGISNLFQKFGSKIYKTNVSLMAGKGNLNNNQHLNEVLRNESYLLLCMNTIDLLTKNSCQPIIIFDADKESNSEIVIQKWAKDAFSDGCNNLMYSFISRGILIPEPIFVKPASKPLLELADALSFAVARYNFKVLNGNAPEIDPKIFGSVNYCTLRNNGKIFFNKNSIGFPFPYINPKGKKQK